MLNKNHHDPLSYYGAIKWARAILQGKFYVLDTETSDFPKNGGTAIQLGIIDQDGNDVVNTLIKNFGPVSPGAARVHGISEKELETAPEFKDMAEEMYNLLHRQQVIAYNSPFDKWAMENTFKQAGHKMPDITWSDAMIEFSRFYGEWNSYHGNFAWKKLTEASEYCRIEVVDAHDALGDVRMTLKVIQYMAAQELPFIIG